MNVVVHPASAALADADLVRAELGAAAYAGLLPRAAWSTAQRLLDAYDRTTSPAARIMLAGEMAWMTVHADAGPAVRVAA